MTTHAPAHQRAHSDGALRSLEQTRLLRAGDLAATAYAGDAGELVHRGPEAFAAAVRDQRFRELVVAVTRGPGALPSDVRESLVGGAPAAALAAFAAKVAKGGLAVTDEDVAALFAGGYGEDAVFECVVAVALAAARARLATVERLLAAT